MDKNTKRKDELRKQLQVLSKERIIELYIHMFFNVVDDKNETDWEDIK